MPLSLSLSLFFELFVSVPVIIAISAHTLAGIRMESFSTEFLTTYFNWNVCANIDRVQIKCTYHIVKCASIERIHFMVGVGGGHSVFYSIFLCWLHGSSLIWSGICAKSILKCVQCNQAKTVMNKNWQRVFMSEPEKTLAFVCNFFLFIHILNLFYIYYDIKFHWTFHHHCRCHNSIQGILNQINCFFSRFVVISIKCIYFFSVAAGIIIRMKNCACVCQLFCSLAIKWKMQINKYN